MENKSMKVSIARGSVMEERFNWMFIDHWRFPISGNSEDKSHKKGKEQSPKHRIILGMYAVVSVSGSTSGKELTCWCRRHERLSFEDALEGGMATHSSIVVWKIPWTEEPGRLQSMDSQRVGHTWGNSAHTYKHKQWCAGKYSTSCLGKTNPYLQHWLVSRV